MYEPRFRLINEPANSVADAYWLTHAGGGTNTLVHRMRTLRADHPVQVRAPWMPAREELADVTFDGDLNELATLLGAQIASERERDGSENPFVLIGHSFGCVLAFRVACDLVARGIMPHRLVVLSFPSPDRSSHEQQLHTLSDDALIREVDALFGGIPEGIRDDAAAQRFFVPGLRLDLGLLEQYEHSPITQPLSVPIVAICGIDDRAVNMSQMQQWNRMTSTTFRLRSMPGDHFFPLGRMPEILQIALWDALPA
jgi:surfactin synthase thioesterase subunit